MLNQIRSEWVKLRSVRSSVVLVSIAAALGVGVSAIVALKTNASFGASDALQGALIAQLLFSVLGVQVIGQEYRFNTIRPTFSINPRRSQVVIAKAAVVMFTVAVVAAVMIASAIVVAQLIANGRGYELDLSAAGTGRVIFGTWLAAIASTAFGFGVGSIVRQPIAGIMIALTWATVVEGIVGGLFQSIAKWLPFNASVNLSTLDADLDPSRLSAYWGGAYALAVFVGLMAIGATIIRRTDA
jgi:ABC-2 type transport system permease protein